MDTRAEQPLERMVTQSRWQLIKSIEDHFDNVIVQKGCSTEMYGRMLKHPSCTETTNTVKVYRTIRNREARTRFYILWQGERQRAIEDAIKELKYCYDHMPSMDIVIIAPRLRGAGGVARMR
jgi:hypothetical protein